MLAACAIAMVCWDHAWFHVARAGARSIGVHETVTCGIGKGSTMSKTCSASSCRAAASAGILAACGAAPADVCVFAEVAAPGTGGALNSCDNAGTAVSATCEISAYQHFNCFTMAHDAETGML